MPSLPVLCTLNAMTDPKTPTAPDLPDSTDSPAVSVEVDESVSADESVGEVAVAKVDAGAEEQDEATDPAADPAADQLADETLEGQFDEAPPIDDGDYSFSTQEQGEGVEGVSDVGVDFDAGIDVESLVRELESTSSPSADSKASGYDSDELSQVPCAPRSERSVLATALSDGDAFALVADKLKGEDFFDIRNRLIFDAMLRLWQAHSQSQNAHRPFGFDAASVYNEIKRAGELIKLGGYDAITRLVLSPGSVQTIEHHAKLVRGQAQVRRIIQAAAQIQGKASEMAVDPDSVFMMVQQQLNELVNDAVQADYKKIADVLPEVTRRAKLARLEGKSTVGISYGYSRLDKITSGMHRTNLLILAARPAMGKTALALNMTLKVAQQSVPTGERAGQPCRVMFFSLEMGADELVQRLLALQSGVKIQDLREGNFDDTDQIAMDRAAMELERCEIFIDDTPGATTVDVRARATRVAQRTGGVDLLVIDYLQLMRGTGGNRQSRQEEVAEISRSLKGLAKELDCTVMALSQLNRQLESRADKRPMMSDLRESGAIEQDADMIMFVYRENRYNSSAPETAAELIIGKHRAGGLGTINMHFDGPLTRFTETTVQFGDDHQGGGSGGFGPL